MNNEPELYLSDVEEDDDNSVLGDIANLSIESDDSEETKLMDISGKKCWDVGLASEEDIEGFLAESNDNIVFILENGKASVCIERETVKTQLLDDKEKYYYLCRGAFQADQTGSLPIGVGNHNVCETPVFGLGFLGLSTRGLVLRENFINAVENTDDQIFVIKPFVPAVKASAVTGVTYLRSGPSGQGTIGSMHCQPDTGDELYYLTAAKRNIVPDTIQQTIETLLEAGCLVKKEEEALTQVAFNGRPASETTENKLRELKENTDFSTFILPAQNVEINYDDDNASQASTVVNDSDNEDDSDNDITDDYDEDITEFIIRQLTRNDDGIGRAIAQTITNQFDNSDNYIYNASNPSEREEIIKIINQTNNRESTETERKTYVIGLFDDSELSISYITNLDGLFVEPYADNRNILIQNFADIEKTLYMLSTFIDHNKNIALAQYNDWLDYNEATREGIIDSYIVLGTHVISPTETSIFIIYAEYFLRTIREFMRTRPLPLSETDIEEWSDLLDTEYYEPLINNRLHRESDVQKITIKNTDDSFEYTFENFDETHTASEFILNYIDI